MKKPKKKEKPTIGKLQKLLWIECKRIIRERYEHDCYTCDATGLVGSNLHTGHVPWPKSVLGAFLKYDLRVLRPQCYNCNINCGGMGAEAYKKMRQEIGEVELNKLEKDRQVTVKAYDWYEMLLEKYRQI